MNILVQGGRVVDPASGRDETADIAIASGRIVAIGAVSPDFAADRRIDARGCIVAPGLVDLAARLREPGHEHEGLLESELAAAAAGGVTSLVCPPDTDPVLDEPGLVEMLKFRARKLSRCRLFPLGALTRGLGGEALTEMAELTEAGCIGFSQAESPVTDTQVLWRALQYASTFGYTVWLRPQDRWLGKGVAASGPVATRLGLSGVPVAAETVALATLFELVRATGARVHLCRLSSAAGVAMLRAAKAEGLPVTADVSIHSLHLTDVDIGYFNPAMRLVPPLRSARDRDALRAALADGTLDALVSDHMPVSADEKTLPFAEAVPGATGLELLLGLALHWGEASGVGLQRALAVITQGPVQVLGKALGSLAASAGRLVEGGVADVCVFDPDARWPVKPELLKSQGTHTPFAFEHSGFELPGRVRATLVAGTVAYEAAPGPRGLMLRASLRAVWRLLRALGHVLHGMAIVLLRFPSLAPAAREARVGWWAAKMLRCLGLELRVQGRFKPGAKLIVANHVSWLDIMAVHAVCPEARFVSKADVQGWPLLNRLIASARTLYIRRESRRDALRVVHDMAAALHAGDTVAVFPEGTTGTGPELLPFHANLLQAAIATGSAIQPVALRYADARHRFSPAATWVGEATLLDSLWALARADGLVVHLEVIAPQASAHADRRALAASLQTLIGERLAAQ